MENVPFHGGNPMLVHPALSVAKRHTGGVAYRRVSSWNGDLGKVFGVKKHRDVPYMSCCNNEPSHPGCQVYHPCCQKNEGAEGCKLMYSCCGSEGKDCS